MNRDFIFGYPGRARQGQGALWIVGARKGPHFSLILAVSTWSYSLYDSQGGTNIKRFNLFMAETSVAAGDNVQLTYLFDNASCHRQAAEAVIPEHHVVRHLPAYLPSLNIWENAFSVWKSQLKRELAEVRPLLVQQPHEEQLATLGQLSERALAAVTVGKCIQWFLDIRHLIARCLQQEDFLQDHAYMFCFWINIQLFGIQLPFLTLSFFVYECIFYNCCTFCQLLTDIPYMKFTL